VRSVSLGGLDRGSAVAAAALGRRRAELLGAGDILVVAVPATVTDAGKHKQNQELTQDCHWRYPD
jgi:hypothetical protein